MKYLLDTTTVSDYLRRDKRVVKRLHQISPKLICISSITKFEIAYGLNKKPSLIPQLKKQLKILYAKTVDLPFDSEAALIAGQIRQELKETGVTIEVPDILIASIGLCNNLVVVTSNVKHFARVSDLKVEDWKVNF
ncbi:MAG: PIN domain-containing protein [Waterburya sp.]